MDKKLKILLTSDLHLGRKENKLLSSARVKTFKKIVALASQHDILLVAGDLIDNSEIDEIYINLINKEFSTLQKNGVAIFFIPGKGETTPDKSKIKTIIETTKFFDKDYVEDFTFKKDDISIIIYGIPSAQNFDITEITKKNEPGFHIALFYVKFMSGNNQPEENPYSFYGKDISKLDLDFYALGHSHNFRIFKYKEKIIGAYPGAPEITEKDKIFDKYIISFAVDNNELQEIKRIKINSTKTITINCEKIKSFKDLASEIKKDYSEKILLKIILTNNRNFSIDENSLENQFPNIYLEDNSFPQINIFSEKYSTENTIRGDFFKLLKETIDEKKLPNEIDETMLAEILNNVIKDGFVDLEERLCNI